MEKRKAFFDRHADRWDERLQYEKKRDRLLEVIKDFELQEGHRVVAAQRHGPVAVAVGS